MHRSRAFLAASLIAAGFMTSAEAATANFVTSTSYTQFSDSPFAAFGAGNTNFHLEDFEDGALNTPGVTALRSFAGGGQFKTGQVAGPGAQIDSVDGDDGVIDGNGNGGHSWYSNGASVMRFVFSADALGQLPTHVGIVWTDVGTVPGQPFGVDDIVLFAYDADNNELGFTGLSNRGDGLVTGGTSEDAFLGAIFDGGIAAITIASFRGSTDFEVDHLQYGYAAPTTVPVPGALLLLGSGLAGLTGFRRRAESNRLGA